MSHSSTYILADFDATLTKAYSSGQKRPSLISVLRDHAYLGEDYAQQAKSLYAKYAPIERDSSLPFEQRKAAMEERRGTHFDLLIEKGLSIAHLQRVIDEWQIQMRDWYEEFFWYLHEQQIPMIIISASGLGVTMIQMMLEQSWVDMTHIHIISNQLQFDQEGVLVDKVKPYIHGMNKDETQIKAFGFDKHIKWRDDIILMGDSLNDLLMATWADYSSLTSFWFLNDPDADEARIQEYEETYDTVVRGDGDLYGVIEYLKG